MTNVLPLRSQSIGNGDNGDLLDRLLVDLSPEQRSRVLDLVMRLNIERDDPLFLIAVATNQLTVLVHDAPDDWSGLFAAFLERLDQWSIQNLTTLEKLAVEAVTVQELETRCATLSHHIGELQAVLKQLIATLESSPVETPDWETSLQKVQRELTLTMTAMHGTHISAGTAVMGAASSVSAHRAAAINAPASRNSLLIPALLVLLSVSVCVGFWRQQSVQQNQFTQLNQRLGWLLHKQNRRDCLDSILPANDPLCTAR